MKNVAYTEYILINALTELVELLAHLKSSISP